MGIPIDSHRCSFLSDQPTSRSDEGCASVPVLLGDVIDQILHSLAEPRAEPETVEPLARVAG
jgi:hypothetical protein